MLFDTASPAPRQKGFALTAEWQEVRLPIAAFAGFDPKAMVGVVICTDTTPGAYELEIDDVRLE